MYAYDTERTLAEGKCAVDELFRFVEENASRLEAHEAEKATFKLLLPIGLAAMKTYFAKRGTGDVGPEVKRADGVALDREAALRERDYFSIFGKFDVPRTCYRTGGEPGVFPLDEQVNLPERCYSYFLQEWMTLFAVEHPFRETGGLFGELFDLKIVESVVMAVARDAHKDYDSFYQQRAAPESKEDLLITGFDGKGVPVIKEEAAKLTAKLGSGEKRQKKKEALVGVCYTVEAKPRMAEALAEQLVDPESARKRREESGEDDATPRATNVRRMASLVRTKEEVMDAIKADAEKRDPKHKRPLAILLDGDLKLWRLVVARFREWKKKFFVLDIIHVISYLWLAANALFGEESPEGKRWVRAKLTELFKGNVGYVIGALKSILKKRRLRKSKREALRTVIRYFHNHRRWMKYDDYLARGLPVSTGAIESACGSLVKHRMEGDGKRWGLTGAEAVLLLRSLKKSHANDLKAYWPYRANQERRRLYESGPGWRPVAHLRLVA